MIEPQTAEEETNGEEQWMPGVFESRNSTFYREGLYGYVSFKTKEEKSPKVFFFPLSR
jgi:hypothetical protein